MPAATPFVLTFTASLALCAATALADPIERAIDTSASNAEFSVQHVFIERVGGKVPIRSGTVTLRPGSVIPVAATAVLDATKLSSGDPDRDASLQSPDFFDTKAFPKWTFASTKVTPRSDTAFGMDGTLEIHGVTQPEHLEVTVSGDAANPKYHAVAHIDRHAFGMSVTRLDPAIGGTVDVTLDIVMRPG